MSLYTIISLSLFIVVIHGLMPVPKTFEKGDKTVKILNKCGMKFVQPNFPDHVIELLRHYHDLMT